ncbi:hypothetical protein [Miltoncostaea oceani]|uniref:hypothetical protein n=1 Tax=Miltoncostaea oceani TaxID=2843216 RepID=UPI001C3DB530|nr:hypothetical protein [Miltoncostaea oceani]
MLTRRLLTAICGASVGMALLATPAQGASTNCNVNASADYVSCLSLNNPVQEVAKANSSTGLPYRFKLLRSSDGATWGYWEWTSTQYHVIGLNLSGLITGQFDNRGSGNPSSFYIELA